jgi:hypothetical protein
MELKKKASLNKPRTNQERKQRGKNKKNTCIQNVTFLVRGNATSDGPYIKGVGLFLKPPIRMGITTKKI